MKHLMIVKILLNIDELEIVLYSLWKICFFGHNKINIIDTHKCFKILLSSKNIINCYVLKQKQKNNYNY